MVCTYSVGYAGSAAGAKAMARYLAASTLDQKLSEAARYYGGEMPPTPSLIDTLARALNDGEIGYTEAVSQLVDAEWEKSVPKDGKFEVKPHWHLHFHPDSWAALASGFDWAEAEERLGEQLYEATERVDRGETPAPSTAKLRPDLSPAFAKALGIDTSRPLMQEQIAHLLNIKRADGGEIDGKRINQPMRSLVEVFGLDPKAPPIGAALENVLAGKRADGEVPRSGSGNGAPLPEKVVAGALKRFHTALGVAPGKEPTDEQLGHIRAGKSAKGFDVNLGEYQRKIHATKQPIGFVDFTFSSDKSLGVAFALAPTEAERAAVLGVHERANADAMRFLEQNIGFATMGANGRLGVEPAKLAWVSFQHFTSRPAVDIAMTDKAGVDYTERRDVPDSLAKPDPNIHTHNTVLSSVMTENGRIASLDLDLLDGVIHQAGAVYHARIAHHARQLGIEVVAGPNGEARFAAIPDDVRALFSKRSAEGLAAARKMAEKKGLVWDDLTGPQQIAMLKAGASVTRNEKEQPGRADTEGDFAGWARQAEAIGYKHRSVLRSNVDAPEVTAVERRAMSYENSLDALDQKLTGTTTLDERELRVQAARGFVNAGGIGADAMADIDAVVGLYRKHGVMQGGAMTSLEWGRDVPVRGNDITTVTTSLHAHQERELVALMKAAAADKSGILSKGQLDAAAAAFLARSPKIDPTSEQWQAQREMMDRLGAAGRFSVAIGAAGSGKSTIVGALNDAWVADGRSVYGIALANRQASDLAAAGISADKRSSIAAFLWRVEHDRYKLDSNSVVVVDELSLLSTRDQLSLMRLQRKHGFTLAEIGDFAQLQSVEASGGLALIKRALPDIPEVVTSVRQKVESERENVRLLREGEIAEVLGRKRADGTLMLVAGGRERTVARVAQLWHERMRANRGDADYSLTVSTVSNRDVLEIGTVIRAKRREAGEIGPEDGIVLDAVDNSRTPYKLALAVGDRVRVFDRVHDAAKGGRNKVLANNGSIVEITELTQKGMVVRNSEGETGLVLWSKLRKTAKDPVRLTYGYAMTRNLAQGVTSDEHIDAPLDGTRSTNAFAAYVALSRHRRTAWMVLDEASIRQDISSKWADGHAQPITPAVLMARVASDLGRKPERGSALEMLDRVVEHQRGTLVGFQQSMEPTERLAKRLSLSQFQESQIAVSDVVRDVADCRQDVAERTAPRVWPVPVSAAADRPEQAARP